MHLNNEELITKLKELVKEERRISWESVRHLREVEKRKLYLERGPSSLWKFCIKVLGYTEGEAQLRIQVLRLTYAVPEVEKKIEDGELSLSVAGQAQTAFNQNPCTEEQKREVIENLSGLSTRETE